MQGGRKFGRKMTPNKKIPLFIESLILIGLLFVATSLYFYYKNYFCQWHLQRNRETGSQKEVEKWLAQGKVSEAKKLAKKLLSEGKILEAKELVIMEYFKDLSYSL